MISLKMSKDYIKDAWCARDIGEYQNAYFLLIVAVWHTLAEIVNLLTKLTRIAERKHE